MAFTAGGICTGCSLLALHCFNSQSRRLGCYSDLQYSWPPYISVLLKYRGTDAMWHQWKSRNLRPHFWRIFCHYILWKNSRCMNWLVIWIAVSPHLQALEFLYVWEEICAGFTVCLPLSLVVYTEKLQARLPPILANLLWVSDNRRGKACIKTKAASYKCSCLYMGF